MKIRLIKKSCNEFPLKYKYNGIDIVKLICAYLICNLHIQPFNIKTIGIDALCNIDFSPLMILCRVAVPFYFTASGFLLFRKIDINNLNGEVVRDYCFKILRLSATWAFILVVGGIGHLWYLGALVLAVIVLSVLIKKGLSLRYMFGISIFLYAIGLLGDSYYGFIEPLKNFSILKLFIEWYEMIFINTRNGIFFGMIFVLIGILFAQKRIVISNKLVVIGWITSIAAMFLETYLLKRFSHPKDFNMLISILPNVFFLFYIATHIELKDRPIYGSIRIIGLGIYFMHLFFKDITLSIIAVIKSRFDLDLINYQFIIAMFFTTSIAIVIERLSKTQKFQWLRYLFS